MIKTATFLISNTDHEKCPAPNKPEFAFIGRSNVGKSSLINMLTNNKKLAKISGTPGKTQLINHFDIDGKWYMVDLPGYGFAKVSKSLKADWDKMIKSYLTSRENLVAVFVLIDSRLDPQNPDLEFLTWCGKNGVPVVIIFTKADKQSKTKTHASVDKFLNASEAIFQEAPLYFITSAETADGKKDVVSFIEEQVKEYYATPN
ncbi:GTP-binding protein YsxC [Rhodonellum psychrophilum GCM71 = DSM 17998]|uniref:Probable GTP-binding protein EngB n=2 Tax=Rhodonellum TaxID=336827 RepID=U5C4W9_9BACT|nr:MULTISPECIES: ribosome biogenesis GTP-binding protein YihA/YsxC [Rhodonellum]ERM84829.1 GTP-binding protein YsxC [Rhodonellum psychrophilum GCM71 = DSM 17998]MDO9552088.1 ribosome biogenesis GTP-binding protein YihA/YsxC [Rhodonellum sp.]SDY71210.1 GTP-binding protein [Rhodonellum ikkaensis]